MNRLNIDWIIGLLVLGAALIIALATYRGVAVSPDVVYYIGGARGVLSSGRYFLSTFFGTPILNYPPLTSLILAAFAGIGRVDLFTAGRWMDIFFFGVSTGIVWIAIRYFTRSMWAALAGSLLFAFSNDIIAVHIRVWSEPSFIAASLAALLFLSKYFENRRDKYLFWSSLMLSFALMSRYAGVTLLVTGVLCIFGAGGMSWLDRVKNSFRLCTLPTLIFVFWMIRNLLYSGQSTNRVYHPGYISWDRVMIYLDQAAGAWLLPIQLSGWIRGGFFIFICGSLLILAIQLKNRQWAPFLVFPIVFYIFLNITQVTTGDGYPDDFVPEYQRYFSTIHGPFLVGAVSLGWNYFTIFRSGIYRYLAVLRLCLLVLLTVARGQNFVREVRRGHFGDLVENILGSSLIRMVRELPSDAPVLFIGTHFNHMYIDAFHSSRTMPTTESPHQSPSALSPKELERVMEVTRISESEIIFLGSAKNIADIAAIFPVVGELDLQIQKIFPEGVILQSRSHVK